MAKFVSKQGNYRVVLKQGQPPEPLTGRIGVAGIYVKFENGEVKIDDERVVYINEKEVKMIDLMKRHPAFGRDFISVEEGSTDPWVDSRNDKEPEHDVMEIKYGQVGKNLNPKPRIQLSKDKQKVLKEMATEMAMKMAPELAKKLLEQMMAEAKEKKESEPLIPEVDKTTDETK